MSRPGGGQYQRTASHDTDDELLIRKGSHKIHHRRAQTSIGTKMDRIKSGYKGKKNKKKISSISSFSDLFQWYWQHPVANFPIFYFFLCLLSTLFFTFYYFMDNTNSFIFCGITCLTMCSYASYKFKISIGLREQVDDYKKLNLKFAYQNKQLKKKVEAAEEAINELKYTKKKISSSNKTQRENLKKFEQIQKVMNLSGQKIKGNMTHIKDKAQNIYNKWTHEMYSNEREMLRAVYLRYEKHSRNKSKFGIDENGFNEFQSMLPRRYKRRFDKIGQWKTIACGSEMVGYDQFTNLLDIFAEMETYDKNIDMAKSQQMLIPQSSQMSDINDKIKYAYNYSDDQMLNNDMQKPGINAFMPEYSASVLIHGSVDNSFVFDHDVGSGSNSSSNLGSPYVQNQHLSSKNAPPKKVRFK